jgi:hypothetical protein
MMVGICKKTYRKRVLKIKDKYKLRKSSGPYINHVDKENRDAFGMSFGGSTALNLTHASDLIEASAYLDGFFYSSMWQLSHEKQGQCPKSHIVIFFYTIYQFL